MPKLNFFALTIATIALLPTIGFAGDSPKYVRKTFNIKDEYNDTKGISESKIDYYQAVINRGILEYKKDRKAVSTITTTPCNWRDKETLYVILSSGEIYVANVNARHFEIRGDKESRYDCNKEITHAGLAISALIAKKSNLKSQSSIDVELIGAGTLEAKEGRVKWISNCSGHFKPTEDNLKETLKFVSSWGLVNFKKTENKDYHLTKVLGQECVKQQESDFINTDF